MQDQPKKLRPGLHLEYSPTPVLLSYKTFKPHNILVGDDPAQVRFVEQLLDIPCTVVPILHDEDILGKPPQLFRVTASRSLDLSPLVVQKVGIWSLAPIERDSPAAYAIMKYAVQILNLDLKKEQIARYANALTGEEVDDIRVAIWKSVWLLAGTEPQFKPWLRPWQDPRNWMPSEVDPNYRLNALYWELVKYAFVQDKGEVALKRLGKFSPTEFKRLAALKLNTKKVLDTITELSVWRSQKYDPYICTLKISSIWEKQ